MKHLSISAGSAAPPDETDLVDDLGEHLDIRYGAALDLWSALDSDDIDALMASGMVTMPGSVVRLDSGEEVLDARAA